MNGSVSSSSSSLVFVSSSGVLSVDVQFVDWCCVRLLASVHFKEMPDLLATDIFLSFGWALSVSVCVSASGAIEMGCSTFVLPKACPAVHLYFGHCSLLSIIGDGCPRVLHVRCSIVLLNVHIDITFQCIRSIGDLEFAISDHIVNCH